MQELIWMCEIFKAVFFFYQKILPIFFINDKRKISYLYCFRTHLIFVMLQKEIFTVRDWLLQGHTAEKKIELGPKVHMLHIIISLVWHTEFCHLMTLKARKPTNLSIQVNRHTEVQESAHKVNTFILHLFEQVDKCVILYRRAISFLPWMKLTAISGK